MSKPRILFCGTPAFAVASLAALVESDLRPVAVLTQPDRPAGRGKKPSPAPVKSYATAHGIPVMQPETLRGEAIVAQLAVLEPDLMVVAAYGLLLPQAMLDLPRRGCVNVHASLLPRWRGAAPIQAAILAGDATTGISLMHMTAGLDSGPVYARRAIDIGDDETAGDLHDRLAALGAQLLVESLPALLDERLAASPQDESQAAYAPKIQTADAELDWRDSAVRLARKVRAYNPVPGAWFMCAGERVKCWQATPVATAPGPPGTVTTTGGLVVSCADGGLSLERLQRPGRRPVDGREFAARIGLDDAVLPLAGGDP
jgi:methionyl-tRNA formyltransferase